MPLPPALAKRLANRGILSENDVKNNIKEVEEEVIAECYDDVDDNQNSGTDSEDSDEENDKPDPKILDKFKGHHGCPNKSNVYHECTKYCEQRWKNGKKRPKNSYLKARNSLLEKYPLPNNWHEVYDPGTGRFYYWDVENDSVSWLPPNHPRSIVTDSVAQFRFERHAITQNMKEKLSNSESDNSDDDRQKRKRILPPPPVQEIRAKEIRYDREPKRREPRKVIKSNDLDPMDPAAYSDIARGSWNDGLAVETKTGVDTTASGPLFQMRPYPSPGAVLRATSNQSKRK
ncbi:polyglutamine-binding protein 1 [Daktulosphaira vitifoliae]|uniref:polyglutamine-binding protein 1 n=1 Tax=Daktulosphaira vitifoliae TaxID=58002 RepID=UPI0021AAD722|nr:polyglutamine-binding protein 1 [Daktulosphaira vitifoliae]